MLCYESVGMTAYGLCLHPQPAEKRKKKKGNKEKKKDSLGFCLYLCP